MEPTNNYLAELAKKNKRIEELERQIVAAQRREKHLDAMFSVNEQLCKKLQETIESIRTADFNVRPAVAGGAL